MDELFDADLPSLPSSIKKVYLNAAFDQPIILPPSLRWFGLYGRYSHPLHLPHGVLEANFTSFEPCEVSIHLPSTLRKFAIWGEYSQPLHFHEGLLEARIYFNDPDTYEHTIRLPTSLRTLDTNLSLPIPPHLEKLSWSSAAEVGPLPDTLRKLSIAGPDFNRRFKVPSNLLVLDFRYSSFNQTLDLPPGLLKLYLSEAYTQPLRLPDGLKVLKLSLEADYAHPIHLPAGLRKIRVHENNPISLPLPPALEKGIFGFDFNLPVVFPPTMKYVWMRNMEYPHELVVPAGCQLKHQGHFS